MGQNLSAEVLVATIKSHADKNPAATLATPSPSRAGLSSALFLVAATLAMVGWVHFLGSIILRFFLCFF
jgi:hypothetical protein